MKRAIIEQYKADHNFTDADIAKQADVGYATFMRIKNDSKYSPTVKTLEKIAGALNVTVAQLLETDDDLLSPEGGEGK